MHSRPRDDDNAPALQVCRSCGGSAPPHAHLCPHCSAILALGRRTDYFGFLGLPRKLAVDAVDLERRFRALSRQFHPDYFYNADPGERRASLERSSYLNDAYRTLRHPIHRIEYLLKIEGLAAQDPRQRSMQVPPVLLEEVFALNEELDAIRALRAAGGSEDEWKSRLARARGPINRKRAEHEAEIEALSLRWDAVQDRRGIAGAPDGEANDRRAILLALRDRLLERNYINNLLAAIERELE
jgi:molecular chaperone HscB